MGLFKFYKEPNGMWAKKITIDLYFSKFLLRFNSYLYKWSCQVLLWVENKTKMPVVQSFNSVLWICSNVNTRLLFKEYLNDTWEKPTRFSRISLLTDLPIILNTTYKIKLFDAYLSYALKIIWSIIKNIHEAQKCSLRSVKLMNP